MAKKMFSLRLDDREISEIKDQAAAAGVTATDLVRTRALGGEGVSKEALMVDVVIGDLAELGIVNQVSRTTELIDRAKSIQAEIGLMNGEARKGKIDLAKGLADGSIPASEAMSRLVTHRPDVVDALRMSLRDISGQIVSVFRAESYGLSAALTPLVLPLATEASDAGRTLMDVDTEAKRIKNWSERAEKWNRRLHVNAEPGPAMPVPPAMPSIDTMDVAIARIKVLEATEKITKIVNIANNAGFFANQVFYVFAGNDKHQVAAWDKYPDEVKYALALALGWKPGMHMRMVDNLAFRRAEARAERELQAETWRDMYGNRA